MLIVLASCWSAVALQTSLPTPVGPFCPFRSEYCARDDIDARMAELSSLAPELSRRVAAMTLDMQMGNAPSPGLVGDVAKEMRRARDAHRAVSEELKRSDDFQALEYAALTAAALERRGGDEAMLERIVDLQIGGMEAFAAGRPPPMPTPEEAKAIAAMAEAGGGPPPLVSQPSQVTALPFSDDSPALRSDVVREEFASLSRDHRALIDFGSSYGAWDGFGQRAYLDQIDAIEERWAVFLGRFKLLGDLNPEFLEQTDAFLEGIGLSRAEYLELHAQSHARLRAAAKEDY